MGVLTSSQVAVRPFRLEISGGLEEIAEKAAARKYHPQGSTVSDGWGGCEDEGRVLGLPPTLPFSVGSPLILDSQDRLPRRLRMRYYWVASSSRAKRQFGDSAAWQLTTELLAADVLLYEERAGVFTGLVTAREVRQFNSVVDSFKKLVQLVDRSASFTQDALPEALSEDFFLWLLYRFQNKAAIGDNLKLMAIHELSSKDRKNRGARFSDEATMERIELAALIALGRVGFGPAKLGIDADLPDVALEIELHRDGGFQPFRTTQYTNLQLDSASEGPMMVDDVWITILPQLRAEYTLDDDWFATGRTDLRGMALDQVRSLLHL
jgi:hypothetical protein